MQFTDSLPSPLPCYLYGIETRDRGHPPLVLLRAVCRDAILGGLLRLQLERHMANFQRDKYSPLFRDATSWVVCSSILALTDAQLAQLTDRRHRGGRENRQGRWLKDLADRIDPLP